jgi:predicted ATPase
MKKRFTKWFTHLFIKYVPGTSKISSNEARRLAKYLTENYSVQQQLVILGEIKDNVILTRVSEIASKMQQIKNNSLDLDLLNTSLEKLSVK